MLFYERQTRVPSGNALKCGCVYKNVYVSPFLIIWAVHLTKRTEQTVQDCIPGPVPPDNHSTAVNGRKSRFRIPRIPQGLALIYTELCTTPSSFSAAVESMGPHTCNPNPDRVIYIILHSYVKDEGPMWCHLGSAHWARQYFGSRFLGSSTQRGWGDNGGGQQLASVCLCGERGGSGFNTHSTGCSFDYWCYHLPIVFAKYVNQISRM